jgi:hypothetical protein
VALYTGSPARIGPSLLVTDDADLLRHMSAPRARWTRGNWYDGMKLDPRVNNILSERNERRHAELRAKMIAGVSLNPPPRLPTGRRRHTFSPWTKVVTSCSTLEGT